MRYLTALLLRNVFAEVFFSISEFSIVVLSLATRLLGIELLLVSEALALHLLPSFMEVVAVLSFCSVEPRLFTRELTLGLSEVPLNFLVVFVVFPLLVCVGSTDITRLVFFEYWLDRGVVGMIITMLRVLRLSVVHLTSIMAFIGPTPVVVLLI